MLFNSLSFLYVFLPITYFIYMLLTRKTQRYVWLTITGYVFYGFWNYKFCFLMLFSTLVSYFAGLGFPLRWIFRCWDSSSTPTLRSIIWAGCFRGWVLVLIHSIWISSCPSESRFIRFTRSPTSSTAIEGS